MRILVQYLLILKKKDNIDTSTLDLKGCSSEEE